MDINLYTLDFTERHILPPSNNEDGYISISGVTEFCGKGSFQLTFHSNAIKRFVSAHPEGYILTWGQFEGYGTDYQFIDAESKSYTLYGSQLNCLLNKVVFPPQTITTETVNAVMTKLIGTVDWLEYDNNSSMTKSVKYSSDKYMPADKFIEEYLSALKLGYRIYIKNKKFHFKLLPSESNPLVLSKENLNIYEMQEDFDNKGVAHGGWYLQSEDDKGNKLEKEEWKYITSSTGSGIYKHDVVLSASSPAAASQELKGYKNVHNTVCKTRNITYGTDYFLGDIVDLQTDDETIKKQVTGIDMWLEGSTYHEEPVLTDWEE